MHVHEQAVIAAFAEQPHASLSTSTLVRKVFGAQYQGIQQDLASPDSKRVRAAMRAKARLHRQLLYHIGKLVEHGTLRIAGTQQHGEKQYQLALESGELVIKDADRTMTITKHETPESFVTRYEERGIVRSRQHALHKVEAYVLVADRFPGIHHLRRALQHIYPHVSDALGIIHFETLLDSDPGSLHEAVLQLIADSKDYGVAITLHIDLMRVRLRHAHLPLFTTLALHHPKRVYVVFSGTDAEFSQQERVLEEIARRFAENGVKLNLQHGGRAPLPYIMGTTGMYVVQASQMRALATVPGVVISNASLCIDLGAVKRTAEEVRACARDAAKTLLARTSLQRRIAQTLLAGLSTVAPLREQFIATESYLRFWNVSLMDEQLYLMDNLRELIRVFCEREQLIFAACGVPLAFSVQLSSAFPHYHAALSERRYTKHPVFGRHSYPAQSLEMRERLTRIYGCDRVRFFREGGFDARDLLVEAQYVFRTYDLPFITFDFNELQKTISLTQFLS